MHMTVKIAQANRHTLYSVNGIRSAYNNNVIINTRSSHSKLAKLTSLEDFCPSTDNPC